MTPRVHRQGNRRAGMRGYRRGKLEPMQREGLFARLLGRVK